MKSTILIFFPGPTKLLIVSGNTKKVEVIDLASKTLGCVNLTDFPVPNWRGIAGLDNHSYPIVCGGTAVLPANNITDRCYTYIPSTKSWTTSSPLTTIRTGAAYTTVSAPSNLGILVAGGFIGNGFLCSMESLDRRTNLWSSANLTSVPECFAYSCMVQFNSTHIFLTGGHNWNVNYSSNTYLYNTVENTWILGPNLLAVRALHACGTINDGSNNPTVIVAGGWVNIEISTTEIYNRILNKWEAGPSFPVNIHGGIIMPHPKGGIVHIGGSALNTIYHLDSISSTWSPLDQTLNVASGDIVINVTTAFMQC